MKRTITIKPDGTITIEESDREDVQPSIVIAPHETGSPPLYPLVPTTVTPYCEPIWRVFPPGWPGTFTC